MSEYKTTVDVDIEDIYKLSGMIDYAIRLLNHETQEGYDSASDQLYEIGYDVTKLLDSGKWKKIEVEDND